MVCNSQSFKQAIFLREFDCPCENIMFSSFSQLFWLMASASDRLRVEVLFKVFFEAGCDPLLCSATVEVIVMLLSVFLILQIAVEVEDDFPEGIVQAEEEEEEQLEAGVAFSGGAEAVFRSRERVPRMSAFRGSVDSTSQTNRSKKRKLDGTILSGQCHNWLVVLNSSLRSCIF